mmetsp:Transcript_5513/g.11234  ORF Transcript_5513/g.11234 Transcript_5513/m.11234 type:complete len:370 (-) Transcript_5513:269-1378(-)
MPRRPDRAQSVLDIWRWHPVVVLLPVAGVVRPAEQEGYGILGSAARRWRLLRNAARWDSVSGRSCVRLGRLRERPLCGAQHLFSARRSVRPDVGPLLNVRHIYGEPLAVPAVIVATQATLAGWQLFCGGLFACWSPDVGNPGLLVACRCVAVLYALVIGACGLVIGVALGAIFLVLLIATVAVWAVLWLAAWIVLVVFEVLLRMLLWAFGFLLYVTKLLPFPIALTDLFFAYWCGQDILSVRVQPLENPADDTIRHDVSVFDMTHQGVNVFTLHFSYLSELLLESIAQLVIQILVASLGGGWSANVLASVIISSVMILLYVVRYLYWLVARPCLYGGPVRGHLLEMHQHYYSLTTDVDNQLDIASPTSE